MREDVHHVGEGMLIDWNQQYSASVKDWRRPIETSQHVPHSPEQGKMASQSVHTTEGDARAAPSSPVRKSWIIRDQSGLFFDPMFYPTNRNSGLATILIDQCRMNPR